MTPGANIQEAADRLRRVRQSGVPCAPIRDLLGEGDVEAAYAVQEINTRRWLGGEERVLSGRKIGLTSRAAQQIIEERRIDYNARRPHTSLGGLTPNEFAARSRSDPNENRAQL
jgi:2-keto-4-pentenoate hydratase